MQLLYELLVLILSRDGRGPSYVEKVQFVSGYPDAVGKEQRISLEPGDFLGGEFITSSGSGHCVLRRNVDFSFSLQSMKIPRLM